MDQNLQNANPIPPEIINPKPKKNILLIFLILLLIILTGVSSFYLGRKTSEPTQIVQKEITSPNPTPFVISVSKQCHFYQEAPKSNFLQSYTVKAGDTLLSIAKTQINDVSRVNDIVLLNSDTYPSLSVDKPFLEQGWILYLPTNIIPPLKDKVLEIDGKIIKGSPKVGYQVNGPTFGGSYLPDENTDFKTVKEFKPGDCVRVIVESNTLRIFGMYLQ